MKAINEQVIQTLGLYRGMVLDAVELQYGDTPEWSQVRSRLLKILGDRGLQGRLLEVLNGSGSSGEQEGHNG